MAAHPNVTVAVIGLGAHGIATVKNFLEAGYEVIGFDANEYVGGLWHWHEGDALTALPTTTINVSRERACFTDFPFPDGTGSYPKAAELDKYQNHYCDHFNLWPHLRLGTRVTSVSREDDGRWRLRLKGSKGGYDLVFDKLIIGTGPHSVTSMPELPGREMFASQILHSRGFKDPAKFAGKTVVVVGAGNTAADTSTILVGVAKKIYWSHRHGCALLPRMLNNGTALDHGATYRTFGLRDLLEAWAPRLAANFIDKWIGNIQNKHYVLNPKWRINTPTPSMSKQNPTVSDTLYAALRDGDVTSVHGPKAFVGPRSIELDDGTILGDVDAIVFCTGYRLDLRWLGKHDPTNLTPDAASPTYDYSAPRLYRNILSHDAPDSLAFIGLSLIFHPAFPMADLNSAALAQIWKRPEDMPSKAEIEDQYRRNLKWRALITSLPNHVGKGPPPLQVETGEHLMWAQKMAGTRLDEHLQWNSLQAWKFWWEDRELSKLLYDGIYSPYAYRLFDSNGRRKKWDGAREAIVKMNADVRARVKNGTLFGDRSLLPGDVVAPTPYV